MRAYAVSNGYLTLLSDRERLTGAHALAPEAGEWLQRRPWLSAPASRSSGMRDEHFRRIGPTRRRPRRRHAARGSGPEQSATGGQSRPTPGTRGHVRDHRALQPANRPRAHRLRSQRTRQHLPRCVVRQSDRACLRRPDVPARRGVLSFALILLPVLAFVGVVTFLRLVQCSTEDLAYARRIALLRSFYLRLSPELEPYLVVRTGAWAAKAPSPGAWQLTLTAAGMVAVINSVVIGACAGLVVEAAGIHSLAIPVALGAVIGAVASRCMSATTVACATRTALRLSISPRSSSHQRRSGS